MHRIYIWFRSKETLDSRPATWLASVGKNEMDGLDPG